MQAAVQRALHSHPRLFLPGFERLHVARKARLSCRPLHFCFSPHDFMSFFPPLLLIFLDRDGHSTVRFFFLSKTRTYYTIYLINHSTYIFNSFLSLFSTLLSPGLHFIFPWTLRAFRPPSGLLRPPARLPCRPYATSCCALGLSGLGALARLVAHRCLYRVLHARSPQTL
ncbi:hypothetical protein FB451DRAFT_181147 [Mycena latifolia]|nr:hypothetical protein FB451DRAFT_181147 [Mycena latifolia]